MDDGVPPVVDRCERGVIPGGAFRIAGILARPAGLRVLPAGPRRSRRAGERQGAAGCTR